MDKYNLETKQAIKDFIDDFMGIFPGLLSEEELLKRITSNMHKNIVFDATLGENIAGQYKGNQVFVSKDTKDVRKARHAGLLTGLPDAYGRGRIIGDYRRVALYGTKLLIEEKRLDLCNIKITSEENIRLREEVFEQIKALKEIKEMALSYGFDISKPATNSKEAVQWLYFGYLASVKENNGAAMSLGRTSTFLDIYIEHGQIISLLLYNSNKTTFVISSNLL